MSETIKGKLEVKNSNGSGTAVVFNGDAKPQSSQSFQFDDPVVGDIGDGDHFIIGQLDMKDTRGNRLISLGHGFLSLHDANEKLAILLNADARSLTLVGKKEPGATQFKVSAKGEIHIPGWLHFVEGILRLGAEANGFGGNGTLFLCDADGKLVLSLKAEGGGEIKIPGGLHFVGSTLRLGPEVNGTGGNGTLFLCDADGKLVLSLKAQGNEVISIPGMLRLANDGSLRLGGEPKGGGTNGKLLFRNAAGKETMRLDGEVGDIVLQNADCAEEFEVEDATDVEPGSVMILADDGRLQLGYQAYDKRVAGVISGAGQYKPGIVLDKQPHLENRWPVALMGKVYCKADAHYGAIAVGDMLTTSPTQGHAMKVGDPFQGFGAVIGKALRPLVHGTGLIPILVSLQ